MRRRVAEQEETAGAVTAAVVDQQCVTAELRRGYVVKSLGVAVVAVVSEQELAVEQGETSKPGFGAPVRVDLHLGLSKKFIVVLPENRSFRGDGFEAFAMELMDEFTGGLVDTVEVGVNSY